MHLSVEGLRPWDWSYPVLQYLREWPTPTVVSSLSRVLSLNTNHPTTEGTSFTSTRRWWRECRHLERPFPTENFLGLGLLTRYGTFTHNEVPVPSFRFQVGLGHIWPRSVSLFGLFFLSDSVKSDRNPRSLLSLLSVLLSGRTRSHRTRVRGLFGLFFGFSHFWLKSVLHSKFFSSSGLGHFIRGSFCSSLRRRRFRDLYSVRAWLSRFPKRKIIIFLVPF